MKTAITQTPWLRASLQQLQQAKEQNRLPHAMLLTGHEGVGKHLLATTFMHWLHCQQPKGMEACEQCENCQLLKAGSFPDHVLIEPEEAGKNIRINQIRSLVDFTHHTAQQGGYRTVLITPADSMNASAQNALLKTLEEPGERTFILLVTHHINQMLATIISRCQQIQVAKPSMDEGITWLKHSDIEENEAKGLLIAAGGAPLKAIALADTDWFLNRQDIFHEIANIPKHPPRVPTLAKKLAGYDAVNLLTACYEWTAAAIKWHYGIKHQADPALVPAFDIMLNIPRTRLFEFQQAVMRALKLVQTSANPNVELLYEQVLMVLVGVPVARDIVAAY
ncbi:MAG TPA: DNA polymerase III subunit delta' [Alcanivoracaceae bacterium]|nr:DNA polymerase III subunit delta' [Alcanivoracaceae bacterium]